MVELPELPDLPSNLRESLPAEVQAYVWALEQQVLSLRAQVMSQGEQIEQLTARLNQTSQNSSRPPSSDPPSAPPRVKAAKRERKRGGQKGHPGHQRRWRPEEELDAIETHWPERCPDCQCELAPVAAEGTAPLRQQVWELPPVEPIVVEHRYEMVCCPRCQKLVRAARPSDVAPGAFGPQVTSMIGLLNGRYRLSKREVARLMDEAFGVQISVGGVVRATEQLSAALTTPYEQVQAAVATSAQANVDETGWKQAGRRCWLWVAVTSVMTFFYLAWSRRKDELEHLLGAAYPGIVGSDRYRAYLRFPVHQRQLCWAHLKRDLVACAQASGATAAWGTRALEVVAHLFALWHRFKHNELDRLTLQQLMLPHRDAFALLLVEGRALPAWSKAYSLCTDLSTLEPALWTFLHVEGVDPTNNAAERALRPAVLWRKGSFGSNSEAGLRFAERILTVSASCRQQQRPLLPFLADALRAHWAGQPAPSLLPAP